MPRFRIACVVAVALCLLAPAAEAAAGRTGVSVAPERSAWSVRWKPEPGRHRGRLVPSDVPVPHREPAYRPPAGTSATADGRPRSASSPASDALGLEKFRQYTQVPVGAGAALMVEAATGNAVLGWNLFANPSLGPAAFLRVTYNSHDTRGSSAAGPGWSVAAAGLSRLGTPLAFGPTARGGAGLPATVRLVDGDGTGHVFRLDRHGSDDPAAWDYAHPPGVHLHLQRTGGRDRAWSFTRPDRTQFFYAVDGRPTAIVDRNGNTLRFRYGTGRDHGPDQVLDASGRVVLTLDHLRAGDAYEYLPVGADSVRTGRVAAGSPHVGRLRAVVDVSGRRVEFRYDAQGRLARITDAAGTAAERSLSLAHLTPQNGAPALLHRVSDPLGHATQLDYTDPSVGPARVRGVTDRRGHTTRFAWAAAKRNRTADSPARTADTMTVTDAAGHPTAYTVDGFGRALRSRDAKGGITRLRWDADHNVVEQREANGARTTWTYDHATGYPLTITDPVANTRDGASTGLSYRTALGGHVADLVEKVTPEGRRWTFGHDAAGNLVRLADPRCNAEGGKPDRCTARHVYDSAGRLLESVDARHSSTKFADHDPTGSPRRIIDALGHTTAFRYDAVGNVLAVTDASGATSTYGYDVRGRPLESRQPVDRAAGRYAVTPPPVYDRNDNVLRSTSPSGAVTTLGYDAGDLMVSAREPKDRAEDPERLTTYVYDPVGNLVRSTSPKGTLTPAPDDFTTRIAYDELHQVVEQRDALGGRTTFRYDAVGNTVAQWDARTNTLKEPHAPTTRTVYDLARRAVAVTDAAGAVQRQVHDRDGHVVRTVDALGNETHLTLDALGAPVEVRVPHRRTADGSVEYRTTRYVYDEAGNRTKVYSPRAVTEDKESLAEVSVFDAVGRLVERRLPYDPSHPRVDRPDVLTYAYDAVGRLVRAGAPAPQGSPSPGATVVTHFDNGWVRTSTDPWQVRTEYDYDPMGHQTSRTLTGDGGSFREMHWQYTADGRILSRRDQGAPVGSDTILVDDSDLGRTTVIGSWAPQSTGGWGNRFVRHEPGVGTAAFTWNALVPTGGTYEVLAHVPAGATAERAAYTVEHDDGTATVTVDQKEAAGGWASLGRWSFDDEKVRRVTLTGASGEAVLADAVRLVRDNPGVEKDRKAFRYDYDPDGNLVAMHDAGLRRQIAKYTVAHDELGRPTTIGEYAAPGDPEPRHTTTYRYDPNGNPTRRTYDAEESTFEYDERELLRSAVTRPEAGGGKTTTTTFTRDLLGRLDQQVKDNGNVLHHTYHLDGLPRQIEEKKSDGTLVARHELEYTPDGHRRRDAARTMDADDHGAHRDVTSTFDYDPRSRIEKVVKTGHGGERTEEYHHDSGSNVVHQTVDGRTTSFRYDRDRLISASASGATASYHYDPFGRLGRVTQAGRETEKYAYDGFDRLVRHHAPTGAGPQTSLTEYTYDPLDRRVTTEAKGETTVSHYVGLTDRLLSEEVDGKKRARYEYGPGGERLSQTKPRTEGGAEQETTYFGYGSRGDVETLTDESGDTKATYGYTAYGQNDAKAFTGVDRPDPAQPDKKPYNVHRYNAKRWDARTGTYDMGFRDYRPELNQFLSRDMYNGALSDLRLTTDPWTANRYAFAGGNPVSNVEIDGHDFFDFLSDVGEVAMDTLELAADVLEGVVGGAAVVGGGLMIATGAAACGLTAPLLATGVGALATAGSCAAGAGAAAAGVGVAGIGFGMIMHGGSEFGSDLNRMMSESRGPGGGAKDEPFRNRMPKTRDEELATANRLGVQPLTPGTKDFDDLLDTGEQLKWAVLEDGRLVVVPKFVKGEEISHAVLSGGDPVRAAGEAQIVGSQGQYWGTHIDNHSGHFQPSLESLEIGKEAFRKFGVVGF
ncbi:RHS repeat-associated core domain-containing protein [Streptomyces sp. NPDC048604]|uniref:golvesin C-terminal-like domain-containing protein n=1 Tax=Streptomyces sp. NPDC048604 TaxID=3365578 RepID=UPI003711B6FD